MARRPTWTVRVEAADERSWTASATIVVDQVTVMTLESPQQAA